MEFSLHYLLMANQSIFQKRLLDGLKGTNLTIGQPKILDYLKNHNGASQKEIALGCHIEPASLTSVLNRMEEKQIIERKMKNGNRRTYYIFLTKTGKELQLIVEHLFIQIEDTAFADISESEKNQFMKTFQKIYENINQKE